MADLSYQTIVRYQKMHDMITPFEDSVEVFWCPFKKGWIEYVTWETHRESILHQAEMALRAVYNQTFFRKLRCKYHLNRIKKIYGEHVETYPMCDDDSNYPLPKDAKERFKRFSYGVSSCSYDIRIAHDLWVWPLYGRLGVAMEYFKIPIDINAKVYNKSSLARRFWDASKTTLIDSGFEGGLTLEISSDRPWPRKIRKGTPIAQIVFTFLDAPTQRPYGEGKKYFHQRSDAPQPAK